MSVHKIHWKGPAPIPWVCSWETKSFASPLEESFKPKQSHTDSQGIDLEDQAGHYTLTWRFFGTWIYCRTCRVLHQFPTPTPRKTNMSLENWWLEDTFRMDSPFSGDMLVFRGASPSSYSRAISKNRLDSSAWRGSGATNRWASFGVMKASAVRLPGTGPIPAWKKGSLPAKKLKFTVSVFEGLC